MNELEAPEAAKRDRNSVELVRSFVAEGGQWTSINPHLFRDRDFSEEKAWGMFLADTVRHLSNSITLHSGKDEYDIEVDTLEALNQELEKPTSTAMGREL